jgi:hypothetical protein
MAMRSIVFALAVIGIAQGASAQELEPFRLGMTPDQARAAAPGAQWRTEDWGDLHMLYAGPSIEVASLPLAPRLHFREGRLTRVVLAVRGLLPSATTCMSMHDLMVRDVERRVGPLDGPAAPGEYGQTFSASTTPGGSHIRAYAHGEPAMVIAHANRRGEHWFEATAFARARSAGEVECSIELELHVEPVAAIAALTPPTQVQLEAAVPIMAPAWDVTPNSRAFELTYPYFAIAQGISGHGVIDCLVIEGGQINCVVKEEQPAGWRFGDAALAQSRYYRIAPMVDGAPTIGKRVEVTVRFNTGMAENPAGGRPSTPRPEPSREQLEALAAQAPSVEELAAAPLLEGATFIEQPDAQDYAAHYPRRALDNGIEGRVVLNCLVRDGGYLRCRVESEEPANMEFGLASLGVTRAFRVPEEISGEPTVGKRVRRTIVWRLGR